MAKAPRELEHFDLVDNEWSSGEQIPVVRISLFDEKGRSEFQRLHSSAGNGDYRWKSDMHKHRDCPWRSGPLYLQGVDRAEKGTTGATMRDSGGQR